MTFELLERLNPAQRTAVEHPGHAVLVIAGAGSGKTRVLTARVAWRLAQGAAPGSILAFTFTNRAAREMRERIARAAPESGAMWVGTFHATALRILRREAAAAGLVPGFTIYDREDQEGVIRGIARELRWTEDSYKVSAVLGAISDAKNALVTPEEFARTAYAPESQRIAEAYARYDATLRANSGLDFDDLIAGTVRLLRDRPDVAERYRARFTHVLVDEYQDTNHAQFRLIHGLVGGTGSLFVVGDDDQSIYGWRGADLSNVLEFEQAFPGAAVVRLEQNYRSTQNILEAANAVIENNVARKGKRLWSEREAGRPIRFVLAADEVDEAREVKRFLLDRKRQGGTLRDCAVMYRTNAQSRALETELRHAMIPYEVVGGVAFYQRCEVKDLLAYLRAAANPADSVAFWRIWNTPRRGLGAGARERVERRIASDRCSTVAGLRSIVEAGELASAARRGATELLELIDGLVARLDAPVEACLEWVLERTGYLESLGEGEDAAERRANVGELMVAARTFAATDGGSVSAFLAEAALVTDVDRMSEDADRVLLLTGHNAKGLEFPAVAVVGLEEGLFPHASSLERTERLEEERRLFYVALTRARDEVLLTAAAYRRRFDGARGGAVSRFIGEIPGRLLEREDRRPVLRGAPAHGGARGGTWSPRDRVRDEESGADAAYDDLEVVAAGTPLRVARNPGARAGRSVFHPQFGYGVVMASEGRGADRKLTVRFGTRIKKVLERFLTGGPANGS